MFVLCFLFSKVVILPALAGQMPPMEGGCISYLVTDSSNYTAIYPEELTYYVSFYSNPVQAAFYIVRLDTSRVLPPTVRRHSKACSAILYCDIDMDVVIRNSIQSDTYASPHTLIFVIQCRQVYKESIKEIIYQKQNSLYFNINHFSTKIVFIVYGTGRGIIEWGVYCYACTELKIWSEIAERRNIRLISSIRVIKIYRQLHATSIESLRNTLGRTLPMKPWNKLHNCEIPRFFLSWQTWSNRNINCFPKWPALHLINRMFNGSLPYSTFQGTYWRGWPNRTRTNNTYMIIEKPMRNFLIYCETNPSILYPVLDVFFNTFDNYTWLCVVLALVGLHVLTKGFLQK